MMRWERCALGRMKCDWQGEETPVWSLKEHLEAVGGEELVILVASVE